MSSPVLSLRGVTRTYDTAQGGATAFGDLGTSTTYVIGGIFQCGAPD